MMTHNTQVRWGILGTADIAVRKVIPAMMKNESCDVIAIASRNQNRAQQVAQQLNLPKYYGTYDELLADQNIEAVYIPLPNHLHVPFTIKALQSGKHVLCEKPIACHTQEAIALLKVAQQYPHLKVMEAFMYYYHPQWIKVKELVDQGKIGSLQTIHTFFSYFNDQPDDIRNQLQYGGGALLDIGCYAVSLSRNLFAREPINIQAMIKYHPHYQTDILTSALLDFEVGISTFTCSTQVSPYQCVHVIGTQGRIEVILPFNTYPDQSCSIVYQNLSHPRQEIKIIAADHFAIITDLFSQAVLQNLPVPIPLTDSIANMRVIDRIFQSANSYG